MRVDSWLKRDRQIQCAFSLLRPQMSPFSASLLHHNQNKVVCSPALNHPVTKAPIVTSRTHSQQVQPSASPIGFHTRQAPVLCRARKDKPLLFCSAGCRFSHKLLSVSGVSVCFHPLFASDLKEGKVFYQDTPPLLGNLMSVEHARPCVCVCGFWSLTCIMRRLR